MPTAKKQRPAAPKSNSSGSNVTETSNLQLPKARAFNLTPKLYENDKKGKRRFKSFRL